MNNMIVNTLKSEKRIITSLGKIIKFDVISSFGVCSLFDNEKYLQFNIPLHFINIEENDIVLFSYMTNLNEGEIEVLEIDKNVNIFIYNKISSKFSNAYVIQKNTIIKDIVLYEKHAYGFKKVRAKEIDKKWCLEKIYSYNENSINQKIILFEVINSLKHDLYDNLQSIELINNKFHLLLSNELTEIYNKLIIDLNKHDLNYLILKLSKLNNNNLYNYIVEKYKDIFNRFSFCIWFIDKQKTLKIPITDSELLLWHDEILKNLYWIDIQKVIYKIFAQCGVNTLIKISFKYLADKGWDINNFIELDLVIKFLNQFKEILTEINISENNFRCISNSMIVELHDNGLIKHLSNEILYKYIDELEFQINSSDYTNAIIHNNTIKKLRNKFNLTISDKKDVLIEVPVKRLENSHLDNLSKKYFINDEFINEFMIKISLFYSDIEQKNKEIAELLTYIWIFKKFNLKKHWQINNYITNIDAWGDFAELRSLNDHGYQNKIKGITPKFFAIVCNVLNITDDDGSPLKEFEKY